MISGMSTFSLLHFALRQIRNFGKKIGTESCEEQKVLTFMKMRKSFVQSSQASVCFLCKKTKNYL